MYPVSSVLNRSNADPPLLIERFSLLIQLGQEELCNQCHFPPESCLQLLRERRCPLHCTLHDIEDARAPCGHPLKLSSVDHWPHRCATWLADSRKTARDLVDARKDGDCGGSQPTVIGHPLACNRELHGVIGHGLQEFVARDIGLR